MVYDSKNQRKSKQFYDNNHNNAYSAPIRKPLPLIALYPSLLLRIINV